MSQVNRCPWADSSEKMQAYHDHIWGKVEKDNQKMFRALSLEIFQAGLSWATILEKEEEFDKAFENFDIEKVANLDQEKVRSLMENQGIVRNQKKIEAIINNAKIVLSMDQPFSDFVWAYVIDTPVLSPWSHMEEIPSKNYLSDKICEDMKDLGFKFIGSTTIYSFLQAIGVLNDHLLSCDFKFED